MLLTISLLSAAHAAPPEWGDVLTARTPRSPYVTGAATWASGRDSLLFGDLQGGAPLFSLRDKPFSMGLTGNASTSSVWTSDGRSFTGLRNVGLSLWFTFGNDDPDSRSAHSVVVGMRTPIDDIGTSWFLYTPNEVGQWFVVAYDGYIDRDRFDLSLEGRAGLGDALGVDWTWTTVALIEARDDLAVAVGGTVGILPFGSAVAGLRYRPTEAVEVGAGVGLPIPLFASDRTELSLRGTAEITASW
ncbi:MAG: hypothetical protein R3F59_19600 [Myxococcota bacterium]